MCVCNFFFFNDTATTAIYTYGHTLSLHDALPIDRRGARHLLGLLLEPTGADVALTQDCSLLLERRDPGLLPGPVPDGDLAGVDAEPGRAAAPAPAEQVEREGAVRVDVAEDRKSTRLNSSH